MRNIKLKSITTKVILLLLVLFQTLNCEKKKEGKNGEFFTGLFLYNIATDPVCSSFTPESAVAIAELTNLGYPDYYGDISVTASVPPGKQCYYKFTPSSGGLYDFSPFGTRTGSSGTSKGIYHIGLVGKTPTKLPSTTSSFDSENLYTNVPADSSDSNAVVTEPQFYQSANSTRIIIADGTNCTSNCKIGLKITKSGGTTTGSSPNLTCISFGSTTQRIINKARFDESGITFSSDSTPCYLLFVSPRSTTMQFTQTRTDSGGTTPTMTLSVSAAVTSTASTFTSATSTTSTTAATLNGLVTPAGSGRYIETKFSPTPSGFTYRMTNSY